MGSLLVAERGTGAAWGRSRRLWGCSPRRESNQDGSMEEIDECSVLRLEEGSTCGWCARRRAANGARGAAPGSIYRRPKAVRGEKISAGKLCAATMAQRCRGVPRTAGRFNLQWGMAQAWIAEGGPAGRTCTRASSSCCCSLSLSARGVLSSSAATCLSPAARWTAVRMTVWQLGVNVHSGSVEARERRGGKAGEDAAAVWRGGDAVMYGTAWCRRQCAVPSWGRRVARARASASADGALVWQACVWREAAASCLSMAAAARIACAWPCLLLCCYV